MIDPEAIKIWNETISNYFNQMDIGAMRGIQFISPRLDLSNMESVVLHCYNSDVAQATFSDNLDIYPLAIRNTNPEDPLDFNWKLGILSRTSGKDHTNGKPIDPNKIMPPAPTNSPWPEFWCDNLKNWVTKFWPPVK